MLSEIRMCSIISDNIFYLITNDDVNIYNIPYNNCIYVLIYNYTSRNRFTTMNHINERKDNMKKILSLLLAAALLLTLPVSSFNYGYAAEIIKEHVIGNDVETDGPLSLDSSRKLFSLQANVPVIGEAPQLIDQSLFKDSVTVKDMWQEPGSKGTLTAVKKFEKGV